MLTHLPLIQKLWDRGVDIGVGVITSVLIAFIGLCFWRVKLWLDLHAEEEKQRQAHRVGEQLKDEMRTFEALELIARLLGQSKSLALAVEQAGRYPELATVWDHYVAWLKGNQLENLPKNLATLAAYPRWSEGLRGKAQRDNEWDHTQRTMAQIIRETEFPPSEWLASVMRE